MSRRLVAQRLGIAAIGCVAAGIVLGLAANEVLEIPSRIFFLTWLLAATVAGLASRWVLRESVLVTAVFVGAGYVAAVMAPVVVEVAIDPTSNNLWPIAAAAAFTVGLAGGSLGAALGWKARRPGPASEDENRP